MPLSRIVMRLARNPGTEFAGGDDHRGYALTAPLTDDGHAGRGGLRQGAGRLRTCAGSRPTRTRSTAGWRAARPALVLRLRRRRRGRRRAGLSARASTVSRWANTSPSPTRTAGPLTYKVVEVQPAADARPRRCGAPAAERRARRRRRCRSRLALTTATVIGPVLGRRLVAHEAVAVWGRPCARDEGGADAALLRGRRPRRAAGRRG